MKPILVTLPIIFLLVSSYLYRHLGKKEVLKMDLVQFIYAFVISPVIIIWIKAVVFFNLENGIGIISEEYKFLIDIIITTVLLYIYAFVVIHSLTKTFAIRRQKDPLIDIFEHSEYFHLWLSHFVIYSGSMLIIFLAGIINMSLSIDVITNLGQLYLAIGIAFLLSLIAYNAIINYKVKDQDKFIRVLKLEIYLAIFILAFGYLIFRPKFIPQFSLYWLSTIFFISLSTKLNVLKKEPKNKLIRFKNKIRNIF